MSLLCIVLWNSLKLRDLNSSAIVMLQVVQCAYDNEERFGAKLQQLRYVDSGADLEVKRDTVSSEKATAFACRKF